MDLAKELLELQRLLLSAEDSGCPHCISAATLKICEIRANLHPSAVKDGK